MINSFILRKSHKRKNVDQQVQVQRGRWAHSLLKTFENTSALIIVCIINYDKHTLLIIFDLVWCML